MKLWHRLVAALFSAAALASGSALAQGYPTRPITLIVPWPAGGSTDTHLRKLSELASPIVCDMSDAAAIAPAVESAIAALGPIDILVNNAGTTWGAATVDHPLEAWRKVIDLNLTAMFVTSQEVGRRCMVPRRRGKVINIASILGLVGGGDASRPATIAYNTSKGGVVNFTRSLAAEWAQHDINVNAIAPGFFPTRMTQGLVAMLGDAVANKAPLKRAGRPEDLKGITALFASDAGAFITGQIVAVDGGVTAV
jgi:NAD(P)-dependent dehydrogenase (short-subunit alcohol dehydrogenase family)